jgi:hypothetical protein
VRVERIATSKESMRVADVRERGTSSAIRIAATRCVVDLAIHGTSGAALVAIISCNVDEDFTPLAGLVIGGVDLSHSSDDFSNPYREPVPSLAVA